MLLRLAGKVLMFRRSFDASSPGGDEVLMLLRRQTKKLQNLNAIRSIDP